MDHIKLNSYIYTTIAVEIEHDHIATNIKKLLTSIKYIVNTKALSKTSSKRITLINITNTKYI